MQAMNAPERTRTISLTLNTQRISTVIRDPTSEWDMMLISGIKNVALGATGGLESLPYYERYVAHGLLASACLRGARGDLGTHEVSKGSCQLDVGRYGAGVLRRHREGTWVLNHRP